MDTVITQSLLTALRLEVKQVKPFYGNTNIIGLIDAISAEIDAEQPEEEQPEETTDDPRYDAYDAADDAFTALYEEGALAL
jgi:hypothetical protein